MSEHIELALFLLREKISDLNHELKNTENAQAHEEIIEELQNLKMEELQKLNRAVNDIRKQFNL